MFWILIFALGLAEGIPESAGRFCEILHSNGTIDIQRCKVEGENKRSHCYALWQNKSGEISFLKKGCWLDHNGCYDKAECYHQQTADKETEHFFCCCDDNVCNSHVYFHSFNVMSTTKTDVPLAVQHDLSELHRTLFFALLPLAVTTILVLTTFWLWRRYKMHSHQPLSTNCDAPVSPSVGLTPINLIECMASGRYGYVWRAQHLKDEVAVKILPIQERASWDNEHSVYSLPRVNSHPNILKFLAAEVRGEEPNAELWLITQYHPAGSLHGFLKSTSVTWTQLTNLAHSMLTGLAFLHADIPPSNKYLSAKPAVAHCDLKSRNIIIKADLTTCIADFGLSVIFHPGKNPGSQHPQVGTHRYMAPEVLEGAITFSRDAFQRIDMYACGLVLWEIVSRCSFLNESADEHQLPYENELGNLPTLEEMQHLVVVKKARPVIKDSWYKHVGMELLANTMAECWDPDAEARLSAGCVQERLAYLCQSSPVIDETSFLV